MIVSCQFPFVHLQWKALNPVEDCKAEKLGLEMHMLGPKWFYLSEGHSG